MEPNKQLNNIFRGTFILTIAALFIKILSAFYRIPFQNIVGDVGFYIYQQVYPFYGIAVVLSTYGFPVVISKLYTEEIEKNESGNVKQLFAVSLLILTVIGMVCFGLLYGFSGWLANSMDDPMLKSLLRIISIVFLLTPVSSLLRGFFQGSGYMVPTAISQVGEQLIRVITILLSAFVLVRHHESLYTVGNWAMFGSVTGGVTSILVLIICWFRKKNNQIRNTTIHIQQSKEILKIFMSQALPICISSMLLIFIQLADSLNLYSLLVNSGLTSGDAKELKGVYDRGQPLIQLGTVVATSMSLSLVPLITKVKLQKDANALKEKIQLAIKVSIFVGLGATMGLWSIMKQTNIMLFENTDGTNVLAFLSTLIFLTSLIITMTAILQGLGNTFFSAIAILICLILKYSFNLMFVPKFGIMGAALASFLALLITVIMIVIKLYTITGQFLTQKKIYLKLTISTVVMMLFINVFLRVTNIFSGNHVSVRLLASTQALGAVLLGGAVYLFLILKTNLFKEEELSLLPFGSKLMALVRK